MLKINDVERLYLGIQGENNARPITIDVSAWIRIYPNGSVTIWHKRNGDEIPQPTGAVYDSDTMTVRWVPTETDTYVSGEGEAEFRLTDTNVIKKTKAVITGVSPSVTRAGTPLGSDWQSYIDAVDEIRAEAVAAQEAAEDAQEAAETAQGKAEDAQEAAETAQGKAEDAQEAAETAQGKAEDAQEAAETAQGKAEDAQEAAETAQGKAEDAQEAAETAQGKAEDAQEAAETAAESIEDSAAQIATNTADISSLKSAFTNESEKIKKCISDNAVLDSSVTSSSNAYNTIPTTLVNGKFYCMAFTLSADVAGAMVSIHRTSSNSTLVEMLLNNKPLSAGTHYFLFEKTANKLKMRVMLNGANPDGLTLNYYEMRADADYEEFSRLKNDICDYIINIPSITFTDERYINLDGSIETISGLTSFKVSQFIKIPDHTIKVSCRATNFAQVNTHLRIAFYSTNNENSFISGIKLTADPINEPIPSGANYVLIASNTNSGGVYTPIDADIVFIVDEIGIKKIADDEITENVPANKIIKSVMPAYTWTDGKYINVNGIIGSIANNNFKVSGFIEIPSVAEYILCDATNVQTASANLIIAFYKTNSESSFISGIKLQGKPFYEKIPSDANYFVIASNTSSAGALVPLNSDIVFIYGMLIDQLSNGILTIRCPEQYDVIKNETFELFFKGIVNGFTDDYFLYADGNNKGNCFAKKYSIRPTSAGDIALNLNLYDNKNALDYSKSIKLVSHNAPSNPASMKTILCVGDSLTAPGIWVAEFKRRLTANNGTPTGFNLSNVQFIGSVEHDGANYEGYGGWRFSDYNSNDRAGNDKIITCTHDKTEAQDQHSIYQASNGSTWKLETIMTGSIKITLESGTASSFPSSGTLTWVSGGVNHSNIVYTATADAPANPFWNVAEGKVDFADYAERMSVSSIDYVYVLLGWNNYANTMTQYKPNVQTFIDNVHDSFQDAKIILMGLEVPARDGLGFNYTSNLKIANYMQMLNFVFDVDDLYQEISEENQNVYHLSIAGQFDTEHNMQTAEQAVNIRNSDTETVQSNGVHPAESGYLQIADAATRNFVALLDN